MAFDNKRAVRCICRKTHFYEVDGVIIDGPINNLIQLGIALNAGDLNLVLQCKVALVDNTQCGKLIAAARLPKDIRGSVVSSLELKGLAFGAYPIAVLLHFKSDIQVTCLDLVDTGGSGVGEPRESRPNQHGYAEEHSHHAGQQCAFRGFAVCHCFSSFSFTFP
jgi:hypothetical protein